MSASLLAGLNPAQLSAVTAPPGHCLVLAGAGSGKTRVLTHRIAWLIEEQGLWPHSVLALTFTNKAAGEMRARLAGLLSAPTRGMWVGTFHAIAHRLLRLHAQEAGLDPNFQILDADDQHRVVKRAIADLDLDDKRFPVKLGSALINGWKDEGLRPDAVKAGPHPQEQAWIAVYRDYEAACIRAGVVDFAELLLRSFELLRDQQALREHYQQRFQYLLIDEFQDTNGLQYNWVRQFAGPQAAVFAVGDDDQSIYSWRGARVENMQRYTQDYVGCQVIRLEQNYRSTGTILAAANALIAHNPTRLGKELWTAAGKGAPIEVFGAYDESEEARHVVSRILRFVDEGHALADCAILYRSNAQSRVFEEALIQKSLPYRVYGGLRFFERAEIKDALAYLRLIAHPQDDAALERALNTPPRGIGDKTAEVLRQRARDTGRSMWDTLGEEIGGSTLAARARGALKGFRELIEGLRARGLDSELKPQIEAVLESTGLLQHYSREDKLGQDGRADNLEELLNVASRFEYTGQEDQEGLTPLNAFLSYAALEAGERQSEPGADAVQLMTLHAAKGLEFPLVLLTGLEDGLFPTQRAVDDGQTLLEEERRLAYVGITRARQQLVLTHAESRRRHGEISFARPSRFFAELPRELLQEVRPRSRSGLTSAYGTRAAELEKPAIRLGASVHHERFGRGIVIGASGSGEHAQVQVQFEDVGLKILMLAFAKLTVTD